MCTVVQNLEMFLLKISPMVTHHVMFQFLSHFLSASLMPYILVVVVVLLDMAHLRGVGGSQGSAEGGSLLAQVGSFQHGDRTSASEDKMLLYSTR